MPWLMLIALGLFDLGRAVMAYTALGNAAREGARVAIVNQSDSFDCTSLDRLFKCEAAEQSGLMGIQPSQIPDLTVTGTGCPEIGCNVTVSLQYQFEPITPGIRFILPSGITLTAIATMKIERVFSNP
jgi:Flp pilus assembly protein TadG